ncbi:beta-lactamase-like protein [Xylariaceae sp. FL0016]|nr:beta-lactamase-like protein [Xylariaceae sp. FL0016]
MIPPELNIPASTSTVNVSIINTTGTIRGVETSRFLDPMIPGHEFLAVPCYAFLIQHPTLKRSIIFDLGIKKDFTKWPKPLHERVIQGGYVLDIPKDVREILDEQGVDTASIEAVIWSHWHFDHTGDPTTFEPSTALIVGPGVKEHIFPGYPANPDAAFLEADYAGREVKELDFAAAPGLKIGKLSALDYFGDGSFYFLDTPGHAVGHICGLARVTSNPDSFILMGGDAVHHGGEMRPHQWLPLPSDVTPHPFMPMSPSPCPGSLFEPILRNGSREEPIYIPAEKPPVGPKVHYDVPLMIESIKKLQELDAQSNVLVVPAHDVTMLSVVDFFPKPANSFMEKGWVQKTRWAFLADFARATGYEGKIPVEHMGDWSAKK